MIMTDTFIHTIVIEMTLQNITIHIIASPATTHIKMAHLIFHIIIITIDAVALVEKTI